MLRYLLSRNREKCTETDTLSDLIDDKILYANGSKIVFDDATRIPRRTCLIVQAMAGLFVVLNTSVIKKSKM
jgi:hypothetical protein